MDLILKRHEANKSGVFGELIGLGVHTLEHAYPGYGPASLWVPKVPPGTYVCQRGKHILKSGEELETFELQNVPNHTHILFHPGNTQVDSDGCILLGIQQVGVWELHSRLAFKRFMEAQQGLQHFNLTVVDPDPKL